MKTPLSIDRIHEILRTIDDPEIGINIVDLGFVYEVKSDAGGIDLQLGFTSRTCPMKDLLVEWVRSALAAATTQEIRIDTDSAPPWTPDRINADYTTP
ncbi:MAG: metal-sulfur cluster assembly factor [Opitutales bacterium]